MQGHLQQSQLHERQVHLGAGEPSRHHHETISKPYERRYLTSRVSQPLHFLNIKEKKGISYLGPTNPAISNSHRTHSLKSKKVKVRDPGLPNSYR